VLLKVLSSHFRFCQILLNSSLSTSSAARSGHTQQNVSSRTDIWVEHSHLIYPLHLSTVHCALLMFKICIKRDLSVIALFLDPTYFRLKLSFICPPCDVSIYVAMKRHLN
jgi:hypothetical protein